MLGNKRENKGVRARRGEGRDAWEEANLFEQKLKLSCVEEKTKQTSWVIADGTDMILDLFAGLMVVRNCKGRSSSIPIIPFH